MTLALLYIAQHVSSQPTQHNKYSLAPEDGRINVWNMLSNI